MEKLDLLTKSFNRAIWKYPKKNNNKNARRSSNRCKGKIMVTTNKSCDRKRKGFNNVKNSKALGISRLSVLTLLKRGKFI